MQWNEGATVYAPWRSQRRPAVVLRMLKQRVVVHITDVGVRTVSASDLSERAVIKIPWPPKHGAESPADHETRQPVA